MNYLAKIAAGLALAATASFAMAAPSFAHDCGCDDRSDYDSYTWDDVESDIWVGKGGEVVFTLELDPHQTYDIYFVSDLIQDYTVDLDMTIVYPDGHEVTADEAGDDELTVRSGRGGTFTIYIDNYDGQFGTNFELYVD